MKHYLQHALKGLREKMKDKKKLLGTLLPSYAVVPLLILIFSNLIVYYGARVINFALNRTYYDMAGNIDRMLPVVPSFVILYVAAFPFWYITYYLICRSNPDNCYATVVASVTAKLLCGVLFIMFPATIVRPELTGAGLSDKLLGFIYSVDAADNLFPSIHCLESWLCFLFIKDEVKVPRPVKLMSMLLAIGICLSTLFTKQHVFADVVSGVLIAYGAYAFRIRLLAEAPKYHARRKSLKPVA